MEEFDEYSKISMEIDGVITELESQFEDLLNPDTDVPHLQHNEDFVNSANNDINCNNSFDQFPLHENNNDITTIANHSNSLIESANIEINDIVRQLYNGELKVSINPNIREETFEDVPELHHNEDFVNSANNNINENNSFDQFTLYTNMTTIDITSETTSFLITPPESSYNACLNNFSDLKKYTSSSKLSTINSQNIQDYNNDQGPVFIQTDLTFATNSQMQFPTILEYKNNKDDDDVKYLECLKLSEEVIKRTFLDSENITIEHNLVQDLEEESRPIQQQQEQQQLQKEQPQAEQQKHNVKYLEYLNINEEPIKGTFIDVENIGIDLVQDLEEESRPIQQQQEQQQLQKEQPQAEQQKHNVKYLEYLNINEEPIKGTFIDVENIGIDLVQDLEEESRPIQQQQEQQQLQKEQPQAEQQKHNVKYLEYLNINEEPIKGTFIDVENIGIDLVQDLEEESRPIQQQQEQQQLQKEQPQAEQQKHNVKYLEYLNINEEPIKGTFIDVENIGIDLVQDLEEESRPIQQQQEQQQLQKEQPQAEQQKHNVKYLEYLNINEEPIKGTFIDVENIGIDLVQDLEEESRPIQQQQEQQQLQKEQPQAEQQKHNVKYLEYLNINEEPIKGTFIDVENIGIDLVQDLEEESRPIQHKQEQQQLQKQQLQLRKLPDHKNFLSIIVNELHAMATTTNNSSSDYREFTALTNIPIRVNILGWGKVKSNTNKQITEKRMKFRTPLQTKSTIKDGNVQKTHFNSLSMINDQKSSFSINFQLTSLDSSIIEIPIIKDKSPLNRTGRKQKLAKLACDDGVQFFDNEIKIQNKIQKFTNSREDFVTRPQYKKHKYFTSTTLKSPPKFSPKLDDAVEIPIIQDKTGPLNRTGRKKKLVELARDDGLQFFDDNDDSVESSSTKSESKMLTPRCTNCQKLFITSRSRVIHQKGCQVTVAQRDRFKEYIDCDRDLLKPTTKTESSPMNQPKLLEKRVTRSVTKSLVSSSINSGDTVKSVTDSKILTKKKLKKTYFSCTLCNQKFQQESCFKVHVQRHNGMFCCQYCFKSFGFKKIYDNHLRLHCEKIPSIKRRKLNNTTNKV